MKSWLLLLSGLLVWTAHFFGVYIAASLFPGTALARWLTGLITLAAVGALILLALPLLRGRTAPEQDRLAHWLDRLKLLGLALALIAVLYQGLPALNA